MSDAVEAALTRIRGTGPRLNPNVRRLAAFAAVHACPTAAVAFAAGVDTNHILDGTVYRMPFGQSPFAIGRGVQFERLLRKDDYAMLRQVLSAGLDVDFSGATVDDLRAGFPKNRVGLQQRARATRARMAGVRAAPAAPVVLDGAVLAAEVGGVRGYFEADELAISVKGGLLIGENKSWPVIDGRPTDEGAVGSALDQAATYVLMARNTLDEEGRDPGLVSSEVVLVTPRNTGLTPVLHLQDVESRIRRVGILLARVPRVADIAGSVPASVSFGPVADGTRSEAERLDTFQNIAETLGRRYEAGSCLASCGFARACRACVFAAADPAVAGSHIKGVLPTIDDLTRVAALSRGAPPTGAETAAAGPLARAGRLLDDVLDPHRRAA